MQSIQDRMKELNVDISVQEQVMTILSAPNDVRMLYRLEEPEIHDPTEGMKRVMFLDTETTGVQATEDEMVELGYVIVEFALDGTLGNVISVYDELHEPRLPITNSAIHGITNEMVKGKVIDFDAVAKDVDTCNLIVAHNSGFDRKVVERYVPLFKEIPWACSYKDIDWKARGYNTNKLDYLAYLCGFFYDAHRALVDVFAMIQIIRHMNVFKDLVIAAINKQYVLSAMGSPFSKKDLLKDRGYRPKYHAGKFVCWYTTVGDQQLESEKQWLLDEAGCRHVPVQEITSLDRYSVREQL